jgi:hypothetical protein
MLSITKYKSRGLISDPKWFDHSDKNEIGRGLDMAMNAISSHLSSPISLQIKLHVRYGLTRIYSKKAGEYMGVAVSEEESKVESLKIRAMRDTDVLLIPQAGVIAAYWS